MRKCMCRVRLGVLVTVMLLLMVGVPALAEEMSGGGAFVIDLTAIVQAVIALIAAFVTYRVIPWLKARTTADQQTALNIATRTLVYAAEQIYGGGKGKKKLAYVKAKLREKGFDVDIDAIEAAVMELSLEEWGAVNVTEGEMGDGMTGYAVRDDLGK